MFDKHMIELAKKYYARKKVSNLSRANSKIGQQFIKATSFLPTDSCMRNRLWHIYHNTKEVPKCKNCGEVLIWDKDRNTYSQYCSTTCSNTSSSKIEQYKESINQKTTSERDATKKKRKNTFLKKYGVSNPFQHKDVKTKIKQSMLQKYGVNYVKEMRDRAKQSMLQKYGVEYTAQSAKLREKMKNTTLQKYGVENVFSVEQFRNKREKTMLEKYGCIHPLSNDDLLHKCQETNLKKFNRVNHTQQHISLQTLEFLSSKEWLYQQHVVESKTLSMIASELNVNVTTVSNYLHKHDLDTQHYFQSVGETQLNEFIQSLDIATETNVRTLIPPYEIDVYVPTHNIAIEYCGVYWHSEQRGKNKHYHKRKYELCKEKGIQLITIFEDEWLYRQKQVKSKLKSLLGRDDRQRVYARNTKIVEVSTKSKRIFFEQNHIQGDGPGSINIGLTHDNKLVACMSFIKQKNDNYILNRYATSGRVVGGFSKLLKYFKEHYQWNQIISFADLRWSSGNLYQKTGWKVDSIIKPDYCYSPDGLHRIHKFNYRRKYLPNLLKHFDPNLSEKQNCDNNGILRIWDCGKIRFTIKEVNSK